MTHKTPFTDAIIFLLGVILLALIFLCSEQRSNLNPTSKIHPERKTPLSSQSGQKNSDFISGSKTDTTSHSIDDSPVHPKIKRSNNEQLLFSLPHTYIDTVQFSSNLTSQSKEAAGTDQATRYSSLKSMPIGSALSLRIPQCTTTTHIDLFVSKQAFSTHSSIDSAPPTGAQNLRFRQGFH